jgi:hypothetical protein
MVEADFFGENEAPDENTPEFLRTRISNYVQQVRQLDVQIADAEAGLSVLKQQKEELERKKIPDALLEAGLSEIVTMDGLKVTTKMIYGAIPKESKEMAFNWMDQHGHGSLIKRQVSIAFDKGSTDAAKAAEAAIRELGLEPKTSLDVHHQTWASFAKEQTNKGVSLPFDEWGVYVGQKATIKG